jgi:hypothetical protein
MNEPKTIQVAGIPIPCYYCRRIIGFILRKGPEKKHGDLAAEIGKQLNKLETYPVCVECFNKNKITASVLEK